MRIVLLSDTHEKHEQLELPDADMLIHAGDFTMHGDLQKILDFHWWLSGFPHKYKIVIAGNHDRTLELEPYLTEPMLAGVTYLRDQMVEVDGIKIYGSPWTPIFNSDYWRFHTKSDEERRLRWSMIPEGTDILVTHGPAYGVLDGTLEGDLAGDRQLLEAIRRVKPKIHVFGHIHEDYGMEMVDGTTHYNASVVDRLYQVRNEPWVLEVRSGKEMEDDQAQSGHSEDRAGERPREDRIAASD